jgi:hypothetical protein
LRHLGGRRLGVRQVEVAESLEREDEAECYTGRLSIVDTYASYLRRKLDDPYRFTLRTTYRTGHSLYPG